MAMNNPYFGFPTSGYSSPPNPSPYSSTPHGIRSQRPRFGFSGPSLYPRPRSSASKPNPDSFSDSMINNYGTSTSRFDISFSIENGSPYDDSYDTSGSNYYSANDTFSHGQSYDSCMGHGPAANSIPQSDMHIASLLTKPGSSMFGSTKYTYASAFGGKFKKKSASDKNNKKNTGKIKNMATTKVQLRCAICSMEFTSQIPYDMHMRGAKHAKKIKMQQALCAVKPQVDSVAIISTDGQKSFTCEMCNVTANSSLQLQTHIVGTKHKAKLQEKATLQALKSGQAIDASVNGKTNGSLVRPLPPDFGEPQPSKQTKFACDVCNVVVNSEMQLQQHLISRKHQNKVHGKPIIKRKPKNLEHKPAGSGVMANTEGTSSEASSNVGQTCNETSNEASAKVVGVKTLASSFVQGETLQ